MNIIRTPRRVPRGTGVRWVHDWFQLSLIVGGLSLTGCVSNISQADARIALTPLKSIPLSAARSTGRISFTERIPDSAQWKKLIAAWGNPMFVLSVVSPDHHTLRCFDKLGLKVKIEADSQGVHTEPNEWVYGYSIECQNIGVRFRAETGDLLDVEVGVPAAATTQPDELTLIVDWGPKTKDRLVGIGIDDDIRSVVKRIL
jgi:hypothetical protein